MTPCQKLLKQEGSARIESMQQSSATPSLHLGFWGLRKIVACSQSSHCLLVSIVFGAVSSLHPTSFLMIFTLIIPLIHASIGFSSHASQRQGRVVDYSSNETTPSQPHKPNWCVFNLVVAMYREGDTHYTGCSMYSTG